MTDTEMTDGEIAREWIAEISINDGIVDPDRVSEVSSKLYGLIYHDPERAWSIIRRISQSDMSTWAEGNFSAGPLTSFVSQHGRQFAQRIRSYCIEHPEFRDYLLGVVFRADVDAIFDEG